MLLLLTRCLKLAVLAMSLSCLRAVSGSRGGWSEWGQWSDCSVPCGGGTQSRARICDTCWENSWDVSRVPCNEWDCTVGKGGQQMGQKYSEQSTPSAFRSISTGLTSLPPAWNSSVTAEDTVSQLTTPASSSTTVSTTAQGQQGGQKSPESSLSAYSFFTAVNVRSQLTNKHKGNGKRMGKLVFYQASGATSRPLSTKPPVSQSLPAESTSTSTPKAPQLASTSMAPLLASTSMAPKLSSTPTSLHHSTPMIPQLYSDPVTPQLASTLKAPQLTSNPMAPQLAGTPLSPQLVRSPMTPQLASTLIAKGTHIATQLASTSTPRTPQLASTPMAPQLASTPMATHLASTPMAPHLTSTLNAPQLASTLMAPQLASTPMAPQLASTLMAPQLASTPMAPQLASTPMAPQLASTLMAQQQTLAAEDQWGDWSQCEDGWHYREKCDEEFNCDWEEEECLHETLDEEWSVWGICNLGTLRRMRERCSSQYGCEEQEEDCEDAVDKELGIGEGSWGAWKPCVEGLKTRSKCVESEGMGVGRCSEEEVMACFTNFWSKWGDCKAGKQERSKCGASTGCETEQRACGDALLSGQWSLWGRCKDGFRSRQRCNGEGLDCFYEDEECANDREAKWLDWTKCEDGLQERERCREAECEAEVRQCEGQGQVHWTDWSDSTGMWTDEISDSAIFEWDVWASEDSDVQGGQKGWWQEDGGWDVYAL